MRAIFIIFLISCLIASCTSKHNTKINQADYFDLSGFLKEQVIALSKGHLCVKKHIISEKGKQEKSVNIENWEKELYFFFKADINKPSLKGEYRIEKQIHDFQEIITYTAIRKKHKVKKLKLWLNRALKKPEKIQAILRNDNFVYDSDLELLLECKSIDKKWCITSYHIKAVQDILLGNVRKYAIKGDIQWK